MTRWLALLAVLLALGAGSRGGGAARREGVTPKAATVFDLAQARIVDLTHAFDAATPYWPTAPTGFELTTIHKGRTPDGYFYSAFSFCAPEHGGTHLDAPFHFAEGGLAADAVPLRQLLAPAAVIDVTAQAEKDPDYRLAAADVRAFEERHGRIPGGSVILLRTGWSARWPDRKRYLGDDTPGGASRLHFPGYGREAAELLVRERRAGALGLDTASLDHGPSRDFIVHQIAAAANVPGLENLTALGELPPVGAFVVALPMKIAGGSGGPLRAIALLPAP
jgi:kynurenine formamidase